MKLLPLKNILRLVLALSFSVWMAGAACLLGCSKETQASSFNPTNSNETIVGADSCASTGSHDCCAKKASKRKTSADIVSTRSGDQTEMRTLPPTMVEGCPMAVNASAMVSKVRSDTSKAAHARTVPIPVPSNSIASVETHFDQPNLLNRGPTYLRCCVFLI